MVAYLADIFNSPNSLNTSLRETENNIIRAKDGIKPMLKNNSSYRKNVNFKKVSNICPVISAFFSIMRFIPQDVHDLITERFQILKCSFIINFLYIIFLNFR